MSVAAGPPPTPPSPRSPLRTASPPPLARRMNGRSEGTHRREPGGVASRPELWDPWRAPAGADPERARVRLRDGSWTRLRSLRRDDHAALLEWFAGLSPHSRRLRFFGPKPRLAPADVQRLLDVDGDRQHAIVATIGSRVAGIVRYVRDPEDPRQAEIAIGIVDDFQSRGLGLLLLDRILTAAHCRGLVRVVGEALHENRRVGALVRRVAPRSRRSSLGITVQHTIELAPRAELGLLEGELRPPA